MSPRFSRRTALQKFAVEAAALAASARFVRAAESSARARFVEQQPTGAEIWQVTTEEFDQANIYGEMVLSVRAQGTFEAAQGNLLVVRAGQPARVIARGYDFNHCGASRCGRIVWADDWKPPYRIVVAAVRTGRATVICESKTNATNFQNSHAHPYVTPDLKWVIFNSTRTGSPHIHAARIPEKTMEPLLAPAE